MSFRKSKLLIYEGYTLQTPSREPTWDTVRTFLERKLKKKKKRHRLRVVLMGKLGRKGRLTEGMELGNDYMGRKVSGSHQTLSKSTCREG